MISEPNEGMCVIGGAKPAICSHWSTAGTEGLDTVDLKEAKKAARVFNGG